MFDKHIIAMPLFFTAIATADRISYEKRGLAPTKSGRLDLIKNHTFLTIMQKVRFKTSFMLLHKISLTVLSLTPFILNQKENFSIKLLNLTQSYFSKIHNKYIPYYS